MRDRFDEGAPPQAPERLRPRRDRRTRPEPETEIHLVGDPVVLLDPGAYVAGLLRSKRERAYNRHVLTLSWRIIDEADVVLPMWLAVDANGGARPRSRAARLFAAIHGRQLRRHEPFSTAGLLTRLFEVQVVTVTTDNQQQPLPEACWYSKVQTVLRPAAGGRATFF